jgi:hypothetical protein
MSPMKKIAIFSALMMMPLVIAVVIWLGLAVLTAFNAAKFLTDFQKINETKPPLTIAQVEQLMGPPASIEQSGSADQTVTGEVYHYPTHPPGGEVQDFRVIFVNGVVFHTAISPYIKS